MNGYPMLTSFCSGVDDESCAIGPMRNDHEMTPSPTATINESIRPSRSRPGLRRRTSNKMPAMRQGYTDR